MSPNAFQTHTLPNGANIAYELLGSVNTNDLTPVIFVGGLATARGDSMRLMRELAENRPALVFDHRGIGNSTYSTPARDDDISIESMARDLHSLITSFNWPEVAIIGFSMGGLVTQELVLLPHHVTNPTPLNFRITHVFLTGTMAVAVKEAPFSIQAFDGQAGSKREAVRPAVVTMFDGKWVSDPKNAERMEWWVDTMTQGRPLRTLIKQSRAVGKYKFNAEMHSKIPKSTQILIIHGKVDQVIPFKYAEELLRLIPHSKLVSVGEGRGQVESLDFGHMWFEYFEPRVWFDVIETFLQPQTKL